MRISERKERKATHTMGLMSTPATGGMRRRVGLRMGSVGQAAMFHGSTLRSYLGNQERTTRKRKSTVKIESSGPTTALVVPIHAVSLEAISSMVCCDAPRTAASAGSAEEAGSTVATAAIS